MEEQNKKRSYSAPALEKGFEILELLAEVRAPMSLTQISTTLERSKSEIYRMVAALETRGYIARHEGGDVFHITNKLFDLGMKVPPVGTLVEAAFPIMHRLSAKIMQSCHIAVANQQRMVVIARVQSPAIVGLSVRVGHHLELYKTGSGRVLLSYMPENVREASLQNFAQTDEEFDREKCEALFSRILSKGHARSKSPIVTGLTDLSFPIFLGNTKEVIACLTVPFIEEKGISLTLSKTEEFVKQAAAELSTMAQTYSGF
ncbi:IclR family transcriptional regulator [Paraglaciecola aquimarina]|uniref:IclR family transcriptional regulator n=1 Tax=Paraglaciecola aquimarina TaxID=1235557 RepID=A0ABU3SZI7_9ALTE|nr:IclR family transcriptional regulator [Paraglaciecola aquimarina]MDU0355426.1 IclR family transcriptional regulator [Paraglaciecola aquimarina]